MGEILTRPCLLFVSKGSGRKGGMGRSSSEQYGYGSKGNGRTAEGEENGEEGNGEGGKSRERKDYEGTPRGGRRVKVHYSVS